ncbi:CG4374 CG4374PAlike, partial [Caligus rogercresseyi]
MNEVLNEDLVSLDFRDLMQADLFDLVMMGDNIPDASTCKIGSRRSSSGDENSSALMAALSETRSVISQITLINGEKIWMRDEINNNNNNHISNSNNSSSSVPSSVSSSEEESIQNGYSGRLQLIHSEELLNMDSPEYLPLPKNNALLNVTGRPAGSERRSSSSCSSVDLALKEDSLNHIPEISMEEEEEEDMEEENSLDSSPHSLLR